MNKTKIEWTEFTWNPVVGCDKVSQGCKFCYAKTIHDMRHRAFLDGKRIAKQYHVPFEQVQLKPERLRQPLSLQKPSRIFVNSVSDLFHADVPDDFIAQVFGVMALAERHTFQVLTKRPARMATLLADSAFIALVFEWANFFDRDPGGEWVRDRVWPRPNIWCGTSVESQDAADERIPDLLRTLAAVRWISGEPLLGPIDFSRIAERAGYSLDALEGRETMLGPAKSRGMLGPLDWVVVGGESGNLDQKVRPMHPDWARSIRDQCGNAGVPFLFKQWGDWSPIGWFDAELPTPPDSDAVLLRANGHVWDGAVPADDAAYMLRVGKKKAGRLLDGRTWDEYPGVAA